jgi:predicted acyltransferase
MSQEQDQPLLQVTGHDVEAIPKRKGERLVSLDVLRGITIALMIFVDFCGESTPAIDHSPWDGVKLADFVMPSFDFIVGISLVKSMQVSEIISSRMLSHTCH